MTTRVYIALVVLVPLVVGACAEARGPQSHAEVNNPACVLFCFSDNKVPKKPTDNVVPQ